MKPHYTRANQFALRGDRKRRGFTRSFLRTYYPMLTEPAEACQRCGYVAEWPVVLDHMMELGVGGPDHPHNLIRLCELCHADKPYPRHLQTLSEWRLAIITWAHTRPIVRWD